MTEKIQQIKQIKNHLERNQERYQLGTLLGVVFSFYTYISFVYHPLWWDQAVYMGMGKYLATAGKVGFWEFFRPPILPLFYALIYKLHFSMLFFGKSLVVLSGTGLVYLVYHLASKVRHGAGIWAGMFLAITPVFVSFVRIPLSDIPSAFAAVLALCLFIKRKDFLVGLLVGVACLLRFPQGLVLAPILISVFYREYGQEEKYLQQVSKSIFKILLGFGLLVVPYLISNYIFYGSALSPIRYASQVILYYSYLYFKGFWFYIKELWPTAPFLFLSVFSVGLLSSQFKKETPKNAALFSVFATTLIFCLYFFFQPHKEIRYAIAFIPYLAVLAGAGIIFILNKVHIKYVFKSIIFIGLVLFVIKGSPYVLQGEEERYQGLYDFMSTQAGVYLSTTPVPAAVGNILITELFEGYNSSHSFEEALNRKDKPIDGVIMSSSDIFCQAKSTGGECGQEIANIYKTLRANFTQVYYEKVGLYDVGVFKK